MRVKVEPGARLTGKKPKKFHTMEKIE